MELKGYTALSRPRTSCTNSIRRQVFNVLVFILVVVGLIFNLGYSPLALIGPSEVTFLIGRNQESHDSLPIIKRNTSAKLCDECLELIKKAQPVNLTYVDIAGDHSQHPHKRARNENDNEIGDDQIPDETALRRNPPAFGWSPDVLRNHCLQHDDDYIMITKKVRVDFSQNDPRREHDKIFCVVYTTEKDHDRIRRIRETWGPKCDGFLGVSTKTDASINTYNIPHEGPEIYHNIWQKVRSIWSFVYHNYYDKYDWFHIGGDDMYLIVENLRLYLESDEIRLAQNGGVEFPHGKNESWQVPVYLGRRYKFYGRPDEVFNAGGSGYTMNKAAFKTLMVAGASDFTDLRVAMEDVIVSRIFKKFGIFPYPTKDPDDGERYNPHPPGWHYSYRFPPTEHLRMRDPFYTYSLHPVRFGLDHCSARSLAFHYIKDEDMRRLHALLYGLCPPDTIVDIEVPNITSEFASTEQP